MNNYRKSVEKKRKARIERISKIISKQDYTWSNISEYTDSTNSVCKIKCNHGHNFSVHNKSVLRNVRCTVCFQNLFIGETICRIVLEALIGCELSKTRHIPGLINPRTGRFLEIDGFNKALKIGFEYQGAQHSKFHKFIHKKHKSFLNTKYKDEIKSKFFKQKGWSLIIVDQFNKYDATTVINKITALLEKQFPLITIYSVNERDINKTIKSKIADVLRRTSQFQGVSVVNNPKYVKKIEIFFKKNEITLVEGLFNSKKSALLVKTKQGKLVKISVQSVLKIIEDNIKDNALTHENLKEEQLYKVLNIAKKYSNLTTFKKNNPKLATWIRRHRYTDKLRELFGLGKSEFKGIKKYTDEYLIDEAKKFNTRGQMYKEGRNAYELIILRKLQPLAFAHMKTPSRKKNR